MNTPNTQPKASDSQNVSDTGELVARIGQQLTCERCGNKTDAGAWLGFTYVGAECLTKDDQEYIE